MIPDSYDSTEIEVEEDADLVELEEDADLVELLAK